MVQIVNLVMCGSFDWKNVNPGVMAVVVTLIEPADHTTVDEIAMDEATASND